jgi:hypothetical protein
LPADKAPFVAHRAAKATNDADLVKRLSTKRTEDLIPQAGRNAKIGGSVKMVM